MIDGLIWDFHSASEKPPGEIRTHINNIDFELLERNQQYNHWVNIFCHRNTPNLSWENPGVIQNKMLINYINECNGLQHGSN